MGPHCLSPYLYKLNKGSKNMQQITKAGGILINFAGFLMVKVVPDSPAYVQKCFIF